MPIDVRWMTQGLLLAAAVGAESGGAALAADVSPAKAQAEWKRLKELSEAFAGPEYLERDIDTGDVEKRLAALANMKLVTKQLAEVEEAFGSKIESGSQPYANLGYLIAQFRRDLTAFENAIKQAGSADAVEREIAQARRGVGIATENKAPAWFKPDSDIAKCTAKAHRRLQLLSAIDPDSPAVADCKKKLETLAKEVREAQQTLRADILNANEPPPDDYRGGDRDALLATIKDKWAKAGVDGDVLKVGLVAGAWERRIVWELKDRTLTKTDKSRLQGYVLVKHDDATAVRRSVNFTKDHLAGDRIEAYFLDDPKAEPELGSLILLKKIK